ncbi:MAG: ABC transporter ATP-binding protein [Nitriliruptoraceae bacterium]
MSTGLRGVTVRQGGSTLLHDVDLDLAPGTLTAVFGGDGAGKTTLLRSLVGLLAPVSGEVDVPPPGRLGYAGAAGGVYPDLTVEENLRFAAAAYRLPRELLGPRIAELLEVTALAAARTRRAAHLSGGMRRKLGFACATIHDPTLLVLDEPTTGVDPISRAELWRLVARTIAGGTTAVFSSTYVDEAVRADHVLVLDRGRVLTSGPPETVRRGVAGHVVRLDGVTSEAPSWRRGRFRHAWIAPGAKRPAGAAPIEPDLEDAVIVAALAASATRLPERVR